MQVTGMKYFLSQTMKINALLVLWKSSVWFKLLLWLISEPQRHLYIHQCVLRLLKGARLYTCEIVGAGSGGICGRICKRPFSLLFEGSKLLLSCYAIALGSTTRIIACRQYRSLCGDAVLSSTSQRSPRAPRVCISCWSNGHKPQDELEPHGASRSLGAVRFLCSIPGCLSSNFR